MQRRRLQYFNSLFDARRTAPVVAASAILAQLSLESHHPHGVYSLIVGFSQSGGATGDLDNVELLKNGQRLFIITAAVAPQFNFVHICDPNDTFALRAIAAGSAGATYLASLALSLVHELSSDPNEAPDTMALISIQQQRIGETMDRVAKLLDRLCGEMKVP